MKKIELLCLIMLVGWSVSALAQRLPDTVVPDHYTLELRPNFDTYKFGGDEAIEVRVTRPAKSITLNAADIRFEQVIVSAGGQTQVAQVKVDPQNETATLTVPAQIPAGKAQIRIRYTGELNDQLRGFYRSTAGGRTYAVTQFEATDARRAFPSFDEPAYKATFDISVVAPQEDTVISNGRVVSDKPGPGFGVHTVTFATTPKMSTYLVAFLVGQFECISGLADDVPVRVCAVPGKQQLGQFALRWAEDILKFYDRYYGIKYPFGKLDLIAIPDFEAGAMENTAAITFRDQDLLIDPKTATLDRQKIVAQVIAHEMAHQWFGDLVTMKWWDDIWLNEGFATWMETKPLAVLKPEWGIAQDEQDSAIEAMRTDSLSSTRAIRTNAETPAQINELFDAIAYNKTAAVLRMVESYITPSVFRDSVNQYLQAHAYGNATAEDFWSKVAQVSGKPVDKIMKSFVDQPGIPIVSVAGCAKGEATVNQRRFFVAQPQTKQAEQEWTIPTCVRDAAGGSRSCELLSGATQRMKLGACSPTLNDNAGAQGYYRSGYTMEQIAALAPIAGKTFTPVERLSILENEWALARAGEHPISGYLELANGMTADRTHGVWDSIADSLQFLDENIVNDDGREGYERWVRKFATPVMQQVGWGARADDDYETQKVRADAFLTLGFVGREPQAVAEARKIVHQYISDPASSDPMLSEPAFTIAASQGDAKLYDEMLAAMAKASTPDVYYRYLRTLTEFRDPALIKRTLQLALSDQVRSQDMPILIAQLLANPASREMAWEFVRAHWPEVSKRAGISGNARIVRGTGAFCDAKAQAQVQQFFSEHPAPEAERTLKQSLERIGTCVQFKEGQQADLTAWLTRSSVTQGQ